MAITASNVSEFDMSPMAIQALARGAGDWTVVAVREISKILAEERGRRPEALARGIDELRSRNLISDRETEELKQIVAAFFAAVRGNIAVEVSAATIHDYYGRMSLDRNASPAAVAIASVAARNIALPAPSPQPPGVTFAISITPGSTGAGAVVGAVIGAGVGGAIGGIVGAGIGGVIGGVAGAAIGFSNENSI